MTPSVVYELDILFIYSISICVVFLSFSSKSWWKFSIFHINHFVKCTFVCFLSRHKVINCLLFCVDWCFYMLLFLHFIVCNTLRLMDAETPRHISSSVDNEVYSDYEIIYHCIAVSVFYEFYFQQLKINDWKSLYQSKTNLGSIQRLEMDNLETTGPTF